MIERPGAITLVGALMGLFGWLFFPWVSLNRVDDGVAAFKSLPFVGTLISAFISPSGWQLTISPFTGGLMRFLILATLLLVVVGLIVAIYEFSAGNGLGNQFGLILVGLYGVLALLLIINIPTIINFGTDNNIGLSVAAATGDAKIGFGFWLALLGIIVTGIGLALDMNKGDDSDSAYRSYSTTRYRR